MKTYTTLVISILLSIHIMAQDPGDLDLSYGSSGISLIGFTDMWTTAWAIDIQSNDRAIVSGSIQDHSTMEQDMFCARLDHTGALDNFGNAGNYFSLDNSNFEYIYCSKVLADDRILLGSSYNTIPIPCIVMLDEYGNLDLSFNEIGMRAILGEVYLMTDIDTYSTASGFNILAGGFEMGGFSQMIMLNQEGELVSTFGTDGSYQMPGASMALMSFDIDEDNGFIYSCGYNTETGVMFVMKQDMLTGEVILPFGPGGAVLIPPFGDAQEFHPRRIILEPDGERISIFGDYLHNNGDLDMFAVSLYTLSGDYYTDFGLNGWSTIHLAASDESIYDAKRQSDGKFYLGGSSSGVGDYTFMLVRTDNNGVLDPDFGLNGFSLTPIGYASYTRSIVLSENESRIYSGGYTEELSGIRDIAVTSHYTGYHNGLGISDSNTETPAITIYPNPAEDIISICTDSEDIYLLEVYAINGARLYIEKQSGKNLIINIENLDRGMYFLRVLGSANSRIIKLIKQ